MNFFDITSADISELNDADLRELVGRLCEAEIAKQNLSTLCVDWGGAQEAPDGGIDVRVNSKSILKIQGFVPRKNTGFQVKKNSMPKASCIKEMQKDGQTKSVIAQLADEDGAYIIVSGRDNCSESMRNDRLQGMAEAIKDLPNKDDLLLDFYGSDKLAQSIRKFPGVAIWIRSRLGKPISGWRSFGCWTSVKKGLENKYILSDAPCITDLSVFDKKGLTSLEGLQLVRDKLRKKGSCVRIIGLSGVGKTRFVQALFEENIGENALPQSDVIYADLGGELIPSATDCIEYFIANNISAKVVLDNCPPDVHRELQNRVSQNDVDIALLTIEYDIREDQSEGTDVVQIEPSDEAFVSELVQRNYPQINQLNADKIASFSGGNARVALALANRVEADETLTKLSDDDLFLRLFQQRQGESEHLLEAAELLSLVYSFNVNSSGECDELSILAEIGGLKRKDLYRAQAELLRRQLVQKRGDWRAVLPHAIANKLAIRMLQNTEVNDINDVLFRKENFRLFKSCAHRLGYLHDSEEAMTLAKSWIEKKGASLYNISQSDANYFSIFEYVAPIFPEVALDCLNKAFHQDSAFCSESNPNGLNIVRLLRKLAYDSGSFDRAAFLILKFVEVRGINKSNNVFDYLKGLFSLYLSGTNAPPKQRQDFFKKNINFENPQHLEIAEELFVSIFNTSGWTSSLGFEFGARVRGYGWSPETYRDRLDWYTGFIEVLIPLLGATDLSLQKRVKDIFSKHFNDLWTYAGCSEHLIKIIKGQVKDKPWPEMYLAIKNTLFFNEDKFNEDLKDQLLELEALTAPVDLRSRIEHYILTNRWDLWYEYGAEKEAGEEEKQFNRALEIGKQAFHHQDLLFELIPVFLQKATDLQIPFGKGLAQESHDKKDFFNLLLEGVLSEDVYIKCIGLLEGYIKEVYEQDLGLARELQLKILKYTALKDFFIYSLVICPIDSKIMECLIILAESGKVRAWDFTIVASGRYHEAISDPDLLRLLTAIKELENGTQAIIQILGMRFFRIERDSYQPDEGILFFSRNLIKAILSLDYDESKSIEHLNYQMKNIIQVALNGSLEETEIVEIIDILFRHISSVFWIDSNCIEIIAALLKHYPRIVLDKVFAEIGDVFFSKTISKRLWICDFIEIETLLEWADKDQLKIQFLIRNSSAFLLKETINSCRFEDDIILPVRLSNHTGQLLQMVEDKEVVFEIIYHQLFPQSWSGSRADIIAERAIVFEELLDQDSFLVQNLAETFIARSSKVIGEIRQLEAKENAYREQRFE